MTTTTVAALNSWQRRIIIFTWLTYAAYYLGRSNLSATLPAIEADLALTKSQVGTFVTGFFWAYALGQLVNGQLGDILSPRRIVLLGLLGSAGLNLAFGLTQPFLMLVLIWTLNGYFQATGWGPILRILANWLRPGQRRRISTIFGTCFVAGNAFALFLAGWLAENFGWRTAFILPAFLLALTAVFWYASVRDTPEAAGHTLDQSPQTETSKKSLHLRRMMSGLGASMRRFWSLSIAAAFVGFCIISLIVWLPTYYVEVGGLALDTASSLAALIPVAGIGGTLIIGWGVNRYFAQRETVGLMIVLLVLALLFFIYPFLPLQLVISTLALMAIGGIVYGATSLTLSTMPLSLGEQGEASSTAGLLDFSSNIGGGLSGLAIGFLLQRLDWNATFFAMAAAALMAALFVGITSRRLQSSK